MGPSKKKVFVAVSGGVDSSTAAAILLEVGYDVSGIFMMTCDESESVAVEAQKVAETLGIELHVLDMCKDFEQVIDYFSSDYRQGRTPNPCVFCNRFTNFGKLLQFAKDNGAEYFSTGHYARVMETDTGTGLFASPAEKDQSYALAMIEREVLPHLILPIGDYTKDQTRQLSRQFGLATADREESQEICFIPDDDYVAVLENLLPELARQGNIVDSSGEILGTHQGIHRYTIGQRRGLRVAMGKPYYVVGLDAKNNTVTLGPKEEVMHKKLIATGVNWLIEPPQDSLRANVKIRYNEKASMGSVYIRDELIEVEFDKPVSAITPGQLAVFYVEQGADWRVAGGAWIEGWAD